MDKRVSGAALRYARTVADKSLEDAARAVRRTRGAVSNWETGRALPSERDLETLADFYGVAPETLRDAMGYASQSRPLSLIDWALSAVNHAGAPGIKAAAAGVNRESVAPGRSIRQDYHGISAPLAAAAAG